jgi:hypothetical protein
MRFMERADISEEEAAKAPKEIWMIVDPCDGPHMYRNRQEAEKDLRIWKKEAEKLEKEGIEDSFWDMTGPHRYVLAGSKRGRKKPRT